MQATDWHPVGGLSGSVWLWRKERPGWSLNTVAVRLRGDELMVISPTRGLPEAAHYGLRKAGQVRYLLAPNHHHNLGLEEYLGRYPGAVAVAGEGALPRLRARLPFAVEPLSVLPELPTGVRVMEPEGLANGEVFVEVASGAERLWIVGDAFFNEPSKPRGLTGLILRLTKTSPGLCYGSTFTWIAVEDPAAYRGWIEHELLASPPTVLVPMHGTPERDPRLADRLRALLDERLCVAPPAHH